MKRIDVRLPLVVAATWLAGCGANGVIKGKVVVDGAPLASQTVLLQGGPKLLTATTGADGTFTFSDVDDHTYILSVDVPSTVEHHEQAAVTVSGNNIQVPDLTFVGTASLSGTVVDPSGAPLANAQVIVLGTQLSAVTDASGAYAFTDAPTGAHTVSVTTQGGHAEAQVTLARGDAQTVPLQLVANPPATVTGRVGFFSGSDPTFITVSVPGCNATAQVQADGSYSLSVPAGTWDVYASAKYLPTRKLGEVTVDSGGTAELPQAALSLYEDLPTFGIASATWSVANQTVDSLDRKAAVLELQAGQTVPSFYRFDYQTHALTLLTVGQPVTLSADGQWSALRNDNTVVFQKVGGEAFAVPFAGNFQNVQFFGDSSAAFIQTGGSPGKAYVVNLATQAVTSVDKYQVRALGISRYLIQTTSAAPYNLSLATSSGISDAFTNVSEFQVNNNGDVGFAYAVDACAAAPCPVEVLGPTSDTAVTVQGATSSGSPWETDSLLPYLFLHLDAATYLVDVRDGSNVLLPADFNTGWISPDASRIAFTTAGGNTLYESALPLTDPASLTPVVTGSANLNVTWIGNQTLLGFQNAPTTGNPYRFVIAAGALTQDSDYVVNSGNLSFVGDTWQNAAGNTLTQSGMGPVLVGPAGLSQLPQVISTEVTFVQTPFGLQYQRGARAAVAWDNVNTTLYAADGSVKATLGGVQAVSPYIIDGFLETAKPGNNSLEVVDADTGEELELLEPGLTSLTVTGQLTANAKTLVVAQHSDASGNSVGGSFAILPTLLLN